MMTPKLSDDATRVHGSGPDLVPRQARLGHYFDTSFQRNSAREVMHALLEDYAAALANVLNV